MTEAALWTIEEIIDATGGRLAGAAGAPITGVSIDSRTIEPGDLFVALKGESSDGHDYVTSAFEAGAAATLVERENISGGPLVVVDDCLAALEALGRAARARTNAQVIAITGSVGKTSTKEALRFALGRGRPTHASAQSYNNYVGVPLSLARMPRETAYGVFEIGMNHAGEITPLTKMVRPNVAIVTAVAEAHREFFNSVEEIADAKAEIFLGVEPGGRAILNLDNAYFDRLKDHAKAAGITNITTFGFDENADVHPVKAKLLEDMSSVTAQIGDEMSTFKVGAPGRHWVMNALAVMAAVKVVGGDLGLAGLALAEMAPVQGRGQRRRVALGASTAFWVIDESYNANPTSMRAALETLGHVSVGVDEDRGHGNAFQGRRIAVLGDMMELGDLTERFHRDLAEPIEENGIDLVVTVGAHMTALAKALPGHLHLGHVSEAKEAINLLRPVITPNDVIMIKGSLSVGMARVVKDLGALEDKRSARTARG